MQNYSVSEKGKANKEKEEGKKENGKKIKRMKAGRNQTQENMHTLRGEGTTKEKIN